MLFGESIPKIDANGSCTQSIAQGYYGYEVNNDYAGERNPVTGALNVRSGEYGVADRHFLRTNIVFADGHAKSYVAKDVAIDKSNTADNSLTQFKQYVARFNQTARPPNACTNPDDKGSMWPTDNQGYHDINRARLKWAVVSQCFDEGQWFR